MPQQTILSAGVMSIISSERNAPPIQIKHTNMRQQFQLSNMYHAYLAAAICTFYHLNQTKRFLVKLKKGR